MRIQSIALAAAVSAAGCGTFQVAASMPNPANTKDKLDSTQTVEIAPFKENHHFEATIENYTPTSIGFRVRMLEPGDCGKAESYTVALVDEGGGRHDFKAAGPATQTTQQGRDTMLNDARVAGTVDYAIAAATKFLTLQLRPVDGRNCPAIDFRWDFNQ